MIDYETKTYIALKTYVPKIANIIIVTGKIDLYFEDWSSCAEVEWP